MIVNVIKVWLDNGNINITTEQGETRSLPIADFKLLRNASNEDLQNFEYDKYGIRWEALDEDISFEGFFKRKNEVSDFVTKIKSIPELNISSIARRIGISQSTMAKYICGIKSPSAKREKEISNAIIEIGNELLEVFSPQEHNGYKINDNPPPLELLCEPKAEYCSNNGSKSPLIMAVEDAIHQRALSQKQTAKMLGVSESAFSQIMTSKRPISMRIGKKLYNDLGINPYLILKYS